MGRCLGQLAPVARSEHPGSNTTDVDAGFGTKHAVDDLLARHLEREDHDTVSGLLPAFVWIARAFELLRTGNVDGHVEHEARLAHAWPCRNNRELTVVQAASQAVVSIE